RRLGIDLDLYVGDVGRGIDRQMPIAPYAQRDQRDGEHQHQPAMADGEANEAFEHGGPQWSSSTVDFSMSALTRKLCATTTRSPALSPSSTSTRSASRRPSFTGRTR